MNITFSADEALVKKAREIAVRQGSSLNRMIRDYMEQLASVSDTDRIAEEFAMLAKQKGGESPQGFVFNRED